MSFKCISLNVRGISSPSSIIKIQRNLVRFRSSTIIALQETKIQDPNMALNFNSIFEREYHIFHSYANDRGSGIVTLVRKGFVEGIVRIFQAKGRILGLRLKIGDNSFNFWNVYLPATKYNNKVFLNQLADRNLRGFSKEINYVCGDFNFIEENMDQLNPNTTSNAVLKIFKKNFKDVLKIEDVYRTKFPNEVVYSFFSHGGVQASRIDRVYVSPNAIDSVLNIEYSYVGTNFDHKVISFSISAEILKQNHGFGYSKLNLEVINNDSFQGFCTEELSRFVNKCVRTHDIDIDPFSEWDSLKRNILSIGIGFRKAQYM